MPFTPFQILGMWLRGLLSVAVLVGGVYLLKRWYDDAHVAEPASRREVTAESPRPTPDPDRPAVPARRVFRFEPGWNRNTATLAAALALLTWAFLGRPLAQGVAALAQPKGAGGGPGSGPKSGPLSGSGPDSGTLTKDPDDPKSARNGEIFQISRPDGSELRVECYGPVDAPPIVFTHGWGADSTSWYYTKKALSDRFRLIVWDEPGLGLSKKPDNNDYRLEKMASDLDAVLALAGGRPAVLVGHSIGGMIILTYCQVFPEALGTRVAGLVLVHTSYTNPVRTVSMAKLATALEKPVLVPLLHLTIALWPLMMAMNWLSLINGSAFRSTKSGSFGGTETKAQVGFVAKYLPLARPDVVARGMFGMLAYDATATLAKIPIPALVVVGDQDTTTVPEAGQTIAKNIPGATLATLAPAKHMGLIEHHERFNALVADFVATCQAAGVAGRS